jgi:hypothetical protein
MDQFKKSVHRAMFEEKRGLGAAQRLCTHDVRTAPKGLAQGDLAEPLLESILPQQ